MRTTTVHYDIHAKLTGFGIYSFLRNNGFLENSEITDFILDQPPLHVTAQPIRILESFRHCLLESEADVEWKSERCSEFDGCSMVHLDNPPEA